MKEYTHHLDHNKTGKENGLFTNPNVFQYTNNPHMIQNHQSNNIHSHNAPFGETLKSINLSAGQNRGNDFMEENNKKGTMTNEKREDVEYVIKRENSEMSREDMIDYEEARIENENERSAERLYADIMDAGEDLHIGDAKEMKSELIIQPIEVEKKNNFLGSSN